MDLTGIIGVLLHYALFDEWKDVRESGYQLGDVAQLGPLQVQLQQPLMLSFLVSV